MGFLSGVTSFVTDHSAIIHGVLDLAGFIPGVGAVADLANAAVYAAEGDWGNAALSMVSAVPGIGDTVSLAKKSTKVIKTGVKAVKEMNAVSKAKKMKGLFGLLRGKAQTGARKLSGKAKNLKKLLRELKNGDKKLCLFGRCFTGDTLVYTSRGYITIRQIRKGDDIYSRDEATGETGFKKVDEVCQTETHTIYHIWLSGEEEIKTTAYHPIYVEGRGWVTAINLREGDPVQTMEGTAVITKIEKERHEEQITVYSLHVKDWASFFVSRMRIYVHNGISTCKNLNKRRKKPNYEGYVKSGRGQPPANYSPKGSGRKGAFREAKRASGIPASEHPVSVKPAVDRTGKSIPGRDYTFPGGKVIREHYGHTFPDNPRQNRGTHFNDIHGNHYDYSK